MRILLVFVSGFFALACGTASRAGETPALPGGGPKPGGVLNVRVDPDPFSWDISYSKSEPNDEGIALAYNSLLGFKKGPEYEFSKLVLEPELAERWEVSPDARSFTFHLRKGVKFQNLPPVSGRELTSADVKWTVEYRSRTGEFKEKKLPQGELDYIFEGLDRVETPDRYTAIVQFKEPFSPFINYAASDWNPILPKEIYDQDGHLKDRIAGTGPFVLDVSASQKGTRWVWNKNPDYWDAGKPYIDSVRWLVLSQEATANAAFQTKQLDIRTTLDYQDTQDLTKAVPQAVADKWMVPRTAQMYLSMVPERKSPVLDLRIRKAITLALDRDEINKSLMGGQGEWGVVSAPHGFFTDAEARQIVKQDLNEARRLVVEAGYPTGVALEWPMTTADSTTVVSIAELVQAQLKRAGINVELKFLDYQDQRTKRRTGDFDVDVATSSSGFHDDPDSLQFGRLHSASRQNNGKIKDPELDRLLESSRREANPEKRREIMRAITMRTMEMVWQIGIIHLPKWDVWQPYVKNYRPNFGSRAPYALSWLDK